MLFLTSNILALQEKEVPLSLRWYFESRGSYPEPYLQFADKLRRDGMLDPQSRDLVDAYVEENKEELAFYLSQIFDLDPEPSLRPDSASGGAFSRDLEHRDYYSPEEDELLPIIEGLEEGEYLISDLGDEYWNMWQEGEGYPPRIEGYECIGLSPENCNWSRMGLEPIYRARLDVYREAPVEITLPECVNGNPALGYPEKWDTGDEDEPNYHEDAVLKKYAHIDFTPPESARKAAERGLEIRKEQPKSQRGGLTNAEASKEGIGSGVQRAVNLKNGDPLSPKVVKQMKAFFDRHSAFKHKHKEEPEGKARQSWLQWGGDAGYSWAKKVVAQMEAADAKERQDAIGRFNAKYDTQLTEEILLSDVRNDSDEPVYEWVQGYNRGDSWVPGYVRYYRDRKKKDLKTDAASTPVDYIELATEVSVQQAQPIIDKWIKTIEKEVKKGESLEGLLEKLPDLASKLSLDGFAQLVEEGNIVSHMMGLGDE